MTLQLPKVLFLNSDDADALNLKDVLSQHAIVTCPETLGELTKLLETSRYDALFCAKSFYANGALEEVHQHYPELPVIVTSSTGGEQEWMETLNAGAFDLLAPPYHALSVLYVLEHALTSRYARPLSKTAPRSKTKAI